MSQDINTSRSSISTAINPEMVRVAKNVPVMLSMMGTLDRCEYEAVGAWIVTVSQKKGHWITFIRPDQGEYDNMIKAGYLSETQVEDGWRYELTQFAIEQIFVRQTNQRIHALTCAIPRAHGVRFWDRVKKLFSSAPVFS